VFTGRKHTNIHIYILLQSRNKGHSLSLNRFQIYFSCFSRLKTPLRQNYHSPFSLLKALRVYKLINHLLTTTDPGRFYPKKPHYKVLRSSWADKQSEKRVVGKDFFRTAKEHILISANNLTVYLDIFLRVKLKWSTTVHIYKNDVSFMPYITYGIQKEIYVS